MKNAIKPFLKPFSAGGSPHMSFRFIPYDLNEYVSAFVESLKLGAKRFLIGGATNNAIAFASIVQPMRKDYGFTIHFMDNNSDNAPPASLMQRAAAGNEYDVILVFAVTGFAEVLKSCRTLAPVAAVIAPATAKLPSMLFLCIPKSASVYLARLFEKGLNYQFFPISANTFPTDVINPLALARMLDEGRMVNTSHADPSPMNLQTLSLLKCKAVLHFRDLRQVMLSMVHHLVKIREAGEISRFLQICPTVPREFFFMPFERQLDWVIETYLPMSSAWTENWLDVADAGPDFDILVTTHEEFSRSSEDYIKKALDFYNIPSDVFKKPEIEKDYAVHFRKGETAEWKNVFTKRQIEKANAIIPAKLFERFGWERQ